MARWTEMSSLRVFYGSPSVFQGEPELHQEARKNQDLIPASVHRVFFVFFFHLVTGPRRSLGLKLSGTRVHEPQIRARLGTRRVCIMKTIPPQGNGAVSLIAKWMAPIPLEKSNS